MKLPSQHDAWKRGHKSFSLLNCSALSKIQDKLKIKKKKKKKNPNWGRVWFTYVYRLLGITLYLDLGCVSKYHQSP